MQLEATGKPIRYRLKSGKEVILRPGVPTELPDPAARELLTKAAGKVRPVVPQSQPPEHSMEPLTVEPVENLSPVFWESDGRIVGPAKVTHVAKAGSEFWLLVERGAAWVWINSTLLRSRKAFEEQGKEICNCCGASMFWTSIFGAAACLSCHPPAAADLVEGEGHAR